MGEAVIADGSADPTMRFQAIKPIYLSSRLDSYLLGMHSFKHLNNEACVLKLHRCSSEPEVYCPVLALKEYIRVRPKGNVLLFVDRAGRNLTRSMLVRVMKVIFSQAHLDTTLFNTHSFRTGRTTDLAAKGVSAEKIRVIGRWSSDAYMKYIRPSCLNLPA